MTIAEKIDALEKELAELKEQIKTDIVADYRNKYNNMTYAVASDNEIIPCVFGCYKNTYSCYHTVEYAEMAKEMKEFNDKLLAFKWCYDRNYVPNWDDTSIWKHCVAYNHYDNQYTVHSWFSEKYPTVCFSTKEIAQKCCDWLNGMMGDK